MIVWLFSTIAKLAIATAKLYIEQVIKPTALEITRKMILGMG